ncbi:DUF721 domain-containing protein [Caviibacterium pharyngocola]|uniref:DUF721 domain-containing protein n=1 Tax=Caviibacterium pharyngocola TaxID=28159 RepID=A0A2M8RVP4_9PAST|nr:DciA family protein [Caviibacterium pharyngocola]PJG82954.1 DUF721 domain-containing protein [Caviibacterium pharyngocola]
MKRYKKAVNVQEVLQHSSLGRFMQKGLFIYNLNEQIQQVFPDDFHGLYRVIGMENGILSIEAANATVRQGLLFKQQELLARINKLYPQISALNIKVNPAF